MSVRLRSPKKRRFQIEKVDFAASVAALQNLADQQRPMQRWHSPLRRNDLSKSSVGLEKRLDEAQVFIVNDTDHL